MTCTARTSDGGTTRSRQSRSRLDKTAPAVSTVLERPADANGWYNRPLTVAFTGTDATSGIATCTSGRYAGPDIATALSRRLLHRQRRQSGAPPRSRSSTTRPPPSIFARDARRTGTGARRSRGGSPATRRLVEVFRTPGRNGQGESGIYRGTANGVKDTGLVVGRKYEYRVIGVDEAANRAEQKLEPRRHRRTAEPDSGTADHDEVSAHPRLGTCQGCVLLQRPTDSRGAQGAERLARASSFRLRRTWLYKGRRYRLQPGVYRWYVWPGYGRISAARYAPRPLGSSSFVVTK